MFRNYTRRVNTTALAGIGWDGRGSALVQAGESQSRNIWLSHAKNDLKKKCWQNLSRNKSIGYVRHVNHNRWPRYPGFGLCFDAPVRNVCWGSRHRKWTHPHTFISLLDTKLMQAGSTLGLMPSSVLQVCVQGSLIYLFFFSSSRFWLHRRQQQNRWRLKASK